MSRKKPQARQPRRQIEDELDRALRDTFPASDPVALAQPGPKPRKNDRSGKRQDSHKEPASRH